MAHKTATTIPIMAFVVKWIGSQKYSATIPYTTRKRDSGQSARNNKGKSKADRSILASMASAPQSTSLTAGKMYQPLSNMEDKHSGGGSEYLVLSAITISGGECSGYREK